MKKMRKAFTLLEINLAIMIMAGGILSVMGLYSLGFRESRQSAEDVASSAYADAVIGPLTMAISSTNLRWSVFKDIGNQPSDQGWKNYLNSDGIVSQNPESMASSAFSAFMGDLSSAATGSLNVDSTWPGSDATVSGGLKGGLVVLHDSNSAIVRIAFRASKQPGLLLASPLYYTEVRFQGIVDE